MADVISRRFYADGRYGQIHVREARPAADPGPHRPLICFHQSPLSGTQYRPFQDVMASDRLVLCPDTPGFGGSDGPKDVPSVADYAAAMADLLDGLGFGERGTGPVDILGGHTGSVIGTELAVSRPDLVRRICYPSMALFTADERKAMMERFGGPPPYFDDPDFVATSYRQTVLEGKSTMAPERRLELFTERLRAGVKSWYAPEAVMSYDCEARLRLVKQPALLLVLDDMLAENTRRAAEFLPNAAVLDMTEVSHSSAFEGEAEMVAEALRRFLDA